MHTSTCRIARDVHVTGIVQGVGFRPFVFNLAEEFGLAGWVLNGSDGVRIHIEGACDAVERFIDGISLRAPRMARIEAVESTEAIVGGMPGFSIRASLDDPGAMTLVSPDIATCPDCVDELFDPEDRRYRYPFTNCTNCGPRFTIIDSIPYDRPSTSMRGFELCPECAEEYADPRDRRFHAQPDACFVCGPRLYLLELRGERSPFADDPRAAGASVESERERSDSIIARVVELLHEGRIVAIKGLGGYHLCCDARDDGAVADLRARKHRWGKPLAIMVPDVAAAGRYCEVDEAEANILSDAASPIVLLRRRGDGDMLAVGVADGLREIGVMLPYTPLQHLLLEGFGGPLVMTSGNLTDEPIATDDEDAQRRLSSIADAILSNDRRIVSRYDDSVVRAVDGVTIPVRRARGYAPNPLRLPASLATEEFSVIAAGPEQKATFTLTRGPHAFVSQHIGDLENAETLDSWNSTRELYSNLFRIAPDLVAHDLHPEYLSTKWALASGLPALGVQHHHAHIAAIAAEHGIAEPILGIAFDGTGFGSDGRIWGGEVLLADWTGFTRLAHLRYLPLPGGAAAVRRPARTALGMLVELGLLEHPGASALRSRLAPGEEAVIARMIERGVNTPSTSSMGRLFDAISSLAGVADDSRYEGEAAIALEAAIDMDATGSYRFALDSSSAPVVIDPAPVVTAILDDLAGGASPATVSARFHHAVASLIVDLAQHFRPLSDNRFVALGGGVFMNRFVLEHALPGLRDAGFIPLVSKTLPANDGAVSYGQAVIALASSTKTPIQRHLRER